MKGDPLLAEELNKGFGVDVELIILSNLKDVALQQLKEQDMLSEDERL